MQENKQETKNDRKHELKKLTFFYLGRKYRHIFIQSTHGSNPFSILDCYKISVNIFHLVRLSVMKQECIELVNDTRPHSLNITLRGRQQTGAKATTGNIKRLHCCKIMYIVIVFVGIAEQQSHVTF